MMSKTVNFIIDTVQDSFLRRDFTGATRFLTARIAAGNLDREVEVLCWTYLGIAYRMLAALASDPGEIRQCYSSAEEAYKSALRLDSEDAGNRQALARILLEQGRSPQEVLDVLVEQDHARSPAMTNVFEQHLLLMLIGVTLCLLGRHKEALKYFEWALSEEIRGVVPEPDLSSLFYCRAYGVPIPPFVKDRILWLASQFPTVNTEAVSFVRQL